VASAISEKEAEIASSNPGKFHGDWNYIIKRRTAR